MLSLKLYKYMSYHCYWEESCRCCGIYRGIPHYITYPPGWEAHNIAYPLGWGPHDIGRGQCPRPGQEGAEFPGEEREGGGGGGVIKA
jgi:hypothetical protein